MKCLKRSLGRRERAADVVSKDVFSFLGGRCFLLFLFKFSCMGYSVLLWKPFVIEMFEAELGAPNSKVVLSKVLSALW